jgi:putative Mg2+ transporter-C (MgtC) family protein
VAALQSLVDAASTELADYDDAATFVPLLLRLILAAGLGALLGYEREAMGKSAGMRTHALVGLGAALFVGVPYIANVSDDAVSRVVQGLVAGIGFLGAGAIVKGRPGEEIVGLTTAATIWTTAAIGMAVGLGRDLSAIVAAVGALLILRVMPGGPPGDARPGGAKQP